jgi:hypothetical protein
MLELMREKKKEDKISFRIVCVWLLCVDWGLRGRGGGVCMRLKLVLGQVLRRPQIQEEIRQERLEKQKTKQLVTVANLEWRYAESQITFYAGIDVREEKMTKLVLELNSIVCV